MTIYDEIEKFLNEHGAPAVLMDHIAFVKEQTAVLIRENSTLKNKLSLLIAENKILETQINDLEKVKDDQGGSQGPGNISDK